MILHIWWNIIMAPGTEDFYQSKNIQQKAPEDPI